MLIELEKATCAVSLSSNRPVRMDPTLNRRIALKIFFPISDKEQRKAIWKSLVPPGVSLGPDVRLDILAERYVFSGGLIKNVCLRALCSALNRRRNEAFSENPVLSEADLFRYAEKQAEQIMLRAPLGRYVECFTPLEELPIDEEGRNKLDNPARTLSEKRENNHGVFFVTASNSPSALDAVSTVVKREDAGFFLFTAEELFGADRNEMVKVFYLRYRFSKALSSLYPYGKEELRRNP